MNIAVVSYLGNWISKPKFSHTASILLNSLFDIELRKFFKTDI